MATNSKHTVQVLAFERRSGQFLKGTEIYEPDMVNDHHAEMRCKNATEALLREFKDTVGGILIIVLCQRATCRNCSKHFTEWLVRQLASIDEILLVCSVRNTTWAADAALMMGALRLDAAGGGGPAVALTAIPRSDTGCWVANRIDFDQGEGIPEDRDGEFNKPGNISAWKADVEVAERTLESDRTDVQKELLQAKADGYVQRHETMQDTDENDLSRYHHAGVQRHATMQETGENGQSGYANRREKMQETGANGQTGYQQSRAPKFLGFEPGSSTSAEYKAANDNLAQQKVTASGLPRAKYRSQQAALKKNSEQEIADQSLGSITLLIAEIAKSQLPPSEELQQHYPKLSWAFFAKLPHVQTLLHTSSLTAAAFRPRFVDRGQLWRIDSFSDHAPTHTPNKKAAAPKNAAPKKKVAVVKKKAATKKKKAAAYLSSD
jgi:hypothetical protein